MLWGVSIQGYDGLYLKMRVVWKRKV